MRMEDHVDLGETKAAYTLMDIRKMDARKLMASGRPGDLSLAMLAGGGPEHVLEIAKRAGGLRGPSDSATDFLKPPEHLISLLF